MQHRAPRRLQQHRLGADRLRRPPPNGYAARGLPPLALDDGTIAPTAAGGAMPFTPEYSLPTLRAFYSRFRIHIWTAYGFRDAFNIGAGWYDTDELGIDQGPIVIMIENYRTQRVWQLFMQNAEVQRGLQRAGFVPLPFARSRPAVRARSRRLRPVVERLRWPLLPGRILAATPHLGGLARLRPGH